MQEIRNLNCSSTVAGGILVFLLAILNRVEVEEEERKKLWSGERGGWIVFWLGECRLPWM